MSKSKVGLCW